MDQPSEQLISQIILIYPLQYRANQKKKIKQKKAENDTKRIKQNEFAIIFKQYLLKCC